MTRPIKLFIFFLLITLSSKSFGQTKILDSLRNQIKSTAKDTNRFNVLSAIIKTSRVDFPDTALRYGKQAETLANEIHDQVCLARALNLLGTAYYYRSDL